MTDTTKTQEAIAKIRARVEAGDPPSGEPRVARRVEVYRNIRDHSRWSVRDKKLKRVVMSEPGRIRIVNAVFVVHESGRQRVLAERCKNVHAWIEGDLVPWVTPPPIDELDRVTYNPYVNETFVRVGDGAALVEAEVVFFGLKGRVTAGGLTLIGES